jgi:hypothetical protein
MTWHNPPIMARGRKPNPKVEQEDLSCMGIVRQILPFRNWLSGQAAVDEAQHGNTRLRQVDVLLVLLAAFFNPQVRSLRLIEQLSQLPWVRGHLPLERICRSTLSDALARFDPDALAPLIGQLLEQLPAMGPLGKVDKEVRDLIGISRQLIAADGSMFSAAADVVWALNQGGRGGKSQAVRMNLQLDVERFIPMDLTISGAEEGSEPPAYIGRLLAGVIYLVDRNYVHFGFINAVLAAGSDFVLRMKDNTSFASCDEQVLTARDVEAKVISDRVGVLSATRSRTGPTPPQRLREVILLDPAGERVRLLTTLMDVPAWVIGELYRCRWQIELFLRFFKVSASCEHLISHSRNGITTQFYVAVIACLLMHVRTGRKVNKYQLFLLGQVACGGASLEQVLPILARVEREKELERQRLARKKAIKALAEQKLSPQLPG